MNKLNVLTMAMTGLAGLFGINANQDGAEDLKPSVQYEAAQQMVAFETQCEDCFTQVKDHESRLAFLEKLVAKIDARCNCGKASTQVAAPATSYGTVVPGSERVVAVNGVPVQSWSSQYQTGSGSTGGYAPSYQQVTYSQPVATRTVQTSRPVTRGRLLGGRIFNRRASTSAGTCYTDEYGNQICN